MLTHREYSLSYTPSDDFVVSNDTEDLLPNTGGVLTLFKEITLYQFIYVNSRFRFQFDGKDFATQSSYGQIFRNGVAIGGLRGNFPLDYVTYSEDIDIGGWEVGDKIQLYVKTVNAASSIRNFRIKGHGSEFFNSVV